MQKRRITTVVLLTLSIVLFTNISIAYAASNPFTWGWCTWYAWQRTYDKWGIDIPCRGNARYWATEAQNAGWLVDSIAKADSIAVWTGGDYGHVAYVESVRDGKIYISEMNGNGGFGIISEGYFDNSTGYWKGTSNDNTYYKRSFPKYYIHLVSEPDLDTVDILSGVYVIHSGDNDNYCLDIKNDSKDNNADIQLYHRVQGNDVQKFRIIKWGNGDYYCIKSLHNGRWLDVKLPVEDRANVKLWDDPDKTEVPDEDFWYFEDAGGGYVYIRNKTGYYLDIALDAIEDRANIQVFHSHDHKWRLEEVTDYTTITDGVYTVESAINNDYLLDIKGNSMDVDANIQLIHGEYSPVQMFRFKKQNGSYTIQSVYSNLWLDIKTSIRDNSNVKLWDNCNSPENHWVLENAGDGYVYMRSNADYYLDVQGDQAKDRANIQVYHFVGNNSQRWKLVKVEFKVTFDANGGENPPDPQAKEYGQTLALSSVQPKRSGYDFQGWATSASATTAKYQPGDRYTQDADVTLYAVWRKLPDPVRVLPGVYVIHSAMNDDYCLDITDDSKKNNANIQLYHVEDSPVQKFAIVDGTEGYSYIQSQYNGRWLDVKTPIEDGSIVKLYGTNTDDENSWRFEDAGDGYVWIRNKTGYYLDVNGDSAVNNANVQIYHYTGMNSQKWRLENVTPYTVTVNNDGCGVGTASLDSGVTGTEVTLTASPAEGYQFKEWQVISGGVEITENKFTIGTADVEIKAIFELIPLAITSTITGFDGIYDGQAHGITVSVTEPTNGAVISYGKTEGVYDQTTSPMIMNVADSPMTVFYKITAEGYNPMTGSAVVTISKANFAVAAPKPVNNLFYTGSALNLITAGSVENNYGTLYYAVTTDQNEPAADRYTTSIPTATDVGAYYVWYKAVGDGNHKDSASACVQAVISQADRTALNALIASAEEYYNSIAGNAEYADIAATLKAAIEVAKAIAGDESVTESDVAKAISSLNASVEAAKSDVETAARQVTDEAAAKKVIDAIKALPDNAGLTDKDAVAAARAAYEALTPDQKALIPADVLARLTTAEAQVQQAEEAAQTVEIGKCEITVKDLTYTGKKIKKPTVTVKYNGTKLKEGTDYKISYDKKTKKIGTYKLTVKGKGKYTGSTKVTFKVIPKGTAFSKLTGGNKQITLKWKSVKNIKGYQIEYSVKKDFTKSKKVKIGKAKTLTKTIKKLAAGTTYYVRIRTYTTVSKKTYYSNWSKVKTVKTKGKKAKNASNEQNLDITMNVGEELNLKSMLSAEESGMTWETSDADIATVSEDGVVRALQPGKVTITVTNENGDELVVAIRIKEAEEIIVMDLDDDGILLQIDEDIAGAEEIGEEIEIELSEE